ncbi:sensor histidine kinase [Streptomyces capillispiralis]|uniref:histidine kinase n=1 Tax=Streptomyces capillispiralis TaxID=68182 RepID=A0A561TKW8_9ACTN|nr:sensor histidine kinase [Streptomyces capillispiralis]TWF87722.1 signal transduction histidine kinase [Streptomyces capillispiralis]
MRDMVRRVVRCAVGLIWGAAAAVVELLCTVLAGLVLLPVVAWPRGRRAVLRPVLAGARRLTELERARLRIWLRFHVPPVYGDTQAAGYVAGRWPLGLLGAVVMLSVAIGLGYGTSWMYLWLLVDDIRETEAIAYTSLGGLFLLFLAVQGILGVAELEGKLARRLLGPHHPEALERRIAELSASRAAVVDAVNDERRRIERDLHDGVQQRLVALGMLLGRALRSEDPDRVDRLLRQAHEESRNALEDLREVAWRIYPTTLDEAGLRAALETVAERASVPVRVEYGLTGEPLRAVATVVYFVVCEAVTNAVKHAAPSRIVVEVGSREGALYVSVEDDGRGGANASGSGLFGLARRVAALDGRLEVSSPPGGPTLVTAELPCA